MALTQGYNLEVQPPTFFQGSSPGASVLGAYWLDSDTYELYVWDGSTWQLLLGGLSDEADPIWVAAQAMAAEVTITAPDNTAVVTDANLDTDSKIAIIFVETPEGDVILPGIKRAAGSFQIILAAPPATTAKVGYWIIRY